MEPGEAVVDDGGPLEAVDEVVMLAEVVVFVGDVDEPLSTAVLELPAGVPEDSDSPS